MTFHSLRFALFLLAVLAAFWLLARWRGARTWLLLLASALFYAAWEPWYLVLIAFSTVLDFQCGKAIAASSVGAVRRRWLGLSLAGNLGLLCFFKYWDWGISSLAELLRSLGLEPSLPLLGIAVPVGISFYTFQTLSYTIDIHRGRLQPRRSFPEFALFVSFFPQLVAGPIVRAVQFLPQLDRAPTLDRARLHDALWHIGAGLVKKVLFADVIGRTLVDPVWQQPGSWAPSAHVLALYGFTFQLYGDFAGYSHLAIGTARLFGFDLPENFRAPFRSRSVREFWQRWHITLSSWVRDYVYFPLGGSQVAPLKVYRNLLVTMVLIGLWHGASGLWALFGLLHGLVMAGERRALFRRGGPAPDTRLRAAWSWCLQYHFWVVTLVLVRGTRWDEVGAMLTTFGEQVAVPPWGVVALAAAAISHLGPDALGRRAYAALQRLPTPVAGLAFGALLGFVALVNLGDTPYIYFQF